MSILMGLKDFQLIWHEVSRPLGVVSRKERWKSPEEAHLKKNISINDAKEVFKMAATRAGQLKGRILTLHGSMQLDITDEYNRSSGLTFVIDYFNHGDTISVE